MIPRGNRIILAIALSIGLLGPAMSAQMPGSKKTSNSQKENSPPPRFDDFLVVEEFHGKPARVDLSSHRNARTFRTRLREGAEKGPNFAGHYALVFFGCGNECQQTLIVDLRTGKVYGLAEPPSNRPLQSSRGLDFRLTSKLLIADPPCPKDYNPCVSLGRAGEPIRYYVMEGDGLRLIHKTPCSLVNEQQQCGG